MGKDGSGGIYGGPTGNDKRIILTDAAMFPGIPKKPENEMSSQEISDSLKQLKLVIDKQQALIGKNSQIIENLKDERKGYRIFLASICEDMRDAQKVMPNIPGFQAIIDKINMILGEENVAENENQNNETDPAG